MPEQTPTPIQNPHVGTPDVPFNQEALADQLPSIAEVNAALAGEIARLAAEPDFATRERLAHQALKNSRAVEALDRGHYSADELQAVLQTIHDIDVTAAGFGFGWKIIRHAKGTQALKELSAQKGGILDTMLQRGLDMENWRRNPMTYRRLVETAEYATEARYGTVGEWRKEGRTQLASIAVEALADHRDFPSIYADIVAERIGEPSPGTEEQQLVDFRTAEETYLVDVLGLPKNLARDIRLAIDGRTRKFDKGRLIPLDKGGGVDKDIWSDVMYDMADKVATLGVYKLEQIRKNCGIVNFDRYSLDQLERMYLLTADYLSGDDFRKAADLWSALQKNDVRFVFSDAFGDQNGAFIGTPERMETANNTTLFFEIKHPGEIYRQVIRMKKTMAIQASSITVALHGGIGSMTGGEGGNFFKLVGERSSAKPGEADDPSEFPINESSVGRFLGKYMKSRRDTGEREVILLSCLQANRGPKNRPVVPTAERIAQQTNPADKVAVYAGHTSLNIKKTDTGDLQLLQPDPMNPESRFATVPLDATVHRAKEVTGRNRRGGRRTGKIVTHETVAVIPRM